MHAAEFYALPASLQTFAAYFPADASAWAWLPKIKQALADLRGNTSELALPPGVSVEGEVWIDPTVKLPPTATLIGPAWIGAGTEIRPGAFVRGNVIVGERCVLGNSCEFKNCLLMDDVQVPHFNYVGDSILGNKAHLGAGVVLSNLRLDQQPISLRLPEGVVDTGLRKFGAILGDEAEVGCNAVLQPGTLLGKRALVMPTLAFSGYLAPARIAKGRTSVTQIPRRD
ncbi:UDP-N-acetylglucosamine diphosphorylase [Synoicihabitans lomoniglobus]|uniref:UDP-N-acetylglucosamine diphosphorylase n=1 Tax=Synoicihabitans lomoniglobus TaxID=2909285 RepID=A0AAE9ZUB8_9BACT|nr:UDP-N-acetylglucosamine diphosphorylase [Opitutaceae bacterium LMO-M01]WED63179.1 UDP-N-acetylglucosamine diphosphorylase [Opitutaceae bacterium LMO-M01]